MDLVQPHYIEPREGDGFISLDGEWDFCSADEACEPFSLDFIYRVTIPCSLYHALHRVGALPDPYVGTNSHLYRDTVNKIWYFRRRFTVNEDTADKNAYLCFDGVSYYSRVFLNGELLGEHEGMFGGPAVEVANMLRMGENELIVEARSPVYHYEGDYRYANQNGKVREIFPWNIALDSITSNGDFTVLGIWNHVRLVILPKVHMSRPYLYTQSINENEARLRLEMDIFDGTIRELQKYQTTVFHGWHCYTRAYDTGLTGAVKKDFVEIKTELLSEGKAVYESLDRVPLTDFDALGMDDNFKDAQIFTKEFTLDAPRLWYPNGMGEAHLYDVRLTMLYGGAVVDTLSFKHGVRTFTADYTAGRKFREGWNKFLFKVNGKPFFLKGMNWTPIDFLYDIDPEKYEWCLTLVKNAGIQLIRVWNGGGFPESDVFYDLCDKMGIMVWQDQFVTHHSTAAYPHHVLEAQIAYNLYRTRNHPSLVLICGGNEFVPYTPGNAASMFITQRTVEMLAPDRIYHYTTADKGSAHIYIDMEPVWYRYRYRQLPFVGESGIHSFPNYKTLKQFISSEEASTTLPPLESDAFAEKFPETLNHFTEYNPSRVPRMTARISQIIDMKNITLKELCEASQVQGYEWYQLMIQSMWENYPVCGGIMPWVFKRPWVTAGIQTVDGDDRPGYCYYAVKNAYARINAVWCQEWSVLAPHESLSLQAKILSDDKMNLTDCVLRLTVYAPDLTVAAEYEAKETTEASFGRFTLDDRFTDTCFLVCAEVCRGETLLARSVYFNKCTSLLADEATYEQYRTAPTETLRLDNGPWLKHSVMNAKRAKLTATVTARGAEGKYAYADVLVTNVSDAPAFPVTLDIPDETARCCLSDNFFMLKSGESKTVRVTRDKGDVDEVFLSFWNGDCLTAK